MASPAYFPEGNTGKPNDTRWRTLQKILGNLNDGGGGGGAKQAVFSGHYGGGSPTDVPTASAAVAYDLDAPYAEWKWDGAAWA